MSYEVKKTFNVKYQFLYILVFFLISFNSFSQSEFSFQEVKIMFVSYAPEEDVVGFTKTCNGNVNFKDSTFSVEVPIQEFFLFKSKLKKEFNDTYLESEKYPLANFSGKLKGNFPTDSIGHYTIMTDGTMKIHGQSVGRKIACQISYDGTKYFFRSTFKIAVSDFGISIPEEYSDYVAETVDVEVFGIMQEK